nr:helix-turn-helix domain-containing protein [Pantoea sp. S61]
MRALTNPAPCYSERKTVRKFTLELLHWIEQNLGSSLTIQKIYRKSGYSKWHIQRLFREETGMPLATYIRNRRLARAAQVLKLTNMPIIEIAEALGFGTQQAFTRVFSRHFRTPPRVYRDSRMWNFTGIIPSSTMLRHPLPPPDYVSLDISLSHHHSFTNDVDFHSIECISDKITRLSNLEMTMLEQAETIYSVVHCEPVGRFGDARLKMLLCDTTHSDELESIRMAGSYLKFNLLGSYDEFRHMISTIYHFELPLREEVRAEGPDLLEINSIKTSNGYSYFSGCYYIPVA